MARTPSTMVPLGTAAHNFELPDVVSGKKIKLITEVAPKATLIMFICNHCPFVRHINNQLSKLGEDYMPKGVRIIAINSNDVENYPDDSPENMVLTAREQHYPFPYLFDQTQEIARAYNAACTPDFFLYDKELKLVYRGQLDDSRPGNDIPVTGKSLRDAMDCVLENRPVTNDQKPSLGCNIKWLM